MIKREFTFLKEAIHRYRQGSEHVIKRVHNQLPDALEHLADMLESRSCKPCTLAAKAPRQCAPLSKEVLETVWLANDFLCDKATHLITLAEQN